PGACARLEHLLGRAPADEVVRARQKDLAVSSAELRLRAMEKDPTPVDSVRQEGRVLVLRVSHDAVPLDACEVFCRGEEDGRAGRTVSRTGDHPTLEFVHPDDTSVLETPLLAHRLVIRGEERLGFDSPIVDAVR